MKQWKRICALMMSVLTMGTTMLGAGCEGKETGDNSSSEKHSHQWVSEITQEATCTEKGIKTRTCKVCGEEETEEIEAGHSIVKYGAQTPTCTTIGWGAYEVCEKCDYTTYEVISALGHTYEEGTCTRCGGDISDCTHTWGAYSILVNKTCSTDGLKMRTCTSCQEQELTPIPAGHTLVHSNGVAATCLNSGWGSGLYCENCDYDEREYVSAKGHNYVDGKCINDGCNALSGGGLVISADPLTVAELGAGFNADYLPDKASIKQYSGKVDIALDFEGTVKGWEALAAEYERLQGGSVDINVITTYSGSTYTNRLNEELNNAKTDWDIVDGSLGYASTRRRCVDMYPSISSYNPYCGPQTMWSSVLESSAYKTKEADNSGESYIMNSEVMQTCWFVNDDAFDAAVEKGYLNEYGEAAYPVTWDDLISLCDYMQQAGYTNPLGISLCDASIESLQFTWLLRVYGDYYYRQFYEYIMAGEVGSSWTQYDPTARVPEADPTYGVQWAKLLNIMLDKDCSFGKGYAGMTSEVYLDFVTNLSKMKGYLMKDTYATEFSALRDQFETQSDGKSSPQIILDYQGFGINYDKSDAIDLGYFDYPQMIAGKYTKGDFAGEDIVDNENTITRDIGGNGGFLSVIHHTDNAQNQLNKDFIKFVMSPYGQTIYYKGLAAAGEVPKGLSSVKNDLIVIPSEWKAFFDESNKTITFNGNVDANPFLSWGVRYVHGYTETQNIIRENWRNLLMTGLAEEQQLTPVGFAAKWETAVMKDAADLIAFNGWPSDFWKDPSYILG